MSHRLFRAKLGLISLLMLAGHGLDDAFGADASPAPAPVPAPAASLAVFDIDATPPVGGMMAYDPVTNNWDLGLRARGVVLLGAGQPIVLSAIDWIGIAIEPAGQRPGPQGEGRRGHSST